MVLVKELDLESCEDHLGRCHVVAVGAEVENRCSLLLKQGEDLASLVVAGVVPHQNCVRPPVTVL